MKPISIEWDDGESITAIVRSEGQRMFLFAHGAGTDQHHPMITGVADALADAGHGVVTFNYPYTEAGRRAPDRAPKLLRCHAAVLDRVRRISDLEPIVGGRSMGGRMSTMLAVDRRVGGVVCLAYPLHPAGKPDRLRIEHLPEVPAPMLFFQGSRDALSRPDLFDRHVRSLPTATVVDLEGADHSFRGRGWTPGRIAATVADEYGAWMDRWVAPPL